MAAPAHRRPAPDLVPAPADDLCLGYANTRFWRGSPAPREGLHRLEDVLDWCAAAGLLPAGRIRALRAWWRGRAGAATAAFEESIALRETIYRIFAAASAGTGPPAAELDALNRWLARAPARAEVRRSGSACGWLVAAPEPSAAALLMPVLWSAGDLLVGPRLGRVRQCANPQCLWLFLDASKGGTRRWCAMSACGNRAKAHRHYLRRKRG